MQIVNIGETDPRYNQSIDKTWTQALVSDRNNRTIAQFYGPWAKVHAVEFVRKMKENESAAISEAIKG